MDRPLRIALAAMFVFIAVSHFHRRTRADLIWMVPANLLERALPVSACSAGFSVVPEARQFGVETAGWPTNTAKR